MHDLIHKMKDLRLHGMAESWQSILETRKHQELSFSEGMSFLLDAEAIDREQRRYERLRQQAKFRYQVTLQEVKEDASRGLSKDLLIELQQNKYLKEGIAVLITGATGCGKSYLSSALGHHVCSKGKRVLYFNTQKLLLQLKLSRVEGSIMKLMDKISKAELLILNDFGLSTLNAQQRNDLMEIIEDRHHKHATIISSQLPVSSWYDIIGDSTIADVILDRLVHSSIRVELKGESLRKKL